MDTSETYIKMCEKAAEIQAKKPHGLEGEFIFLPESPWGDKVGWQAGEWQPFDSERYIWLPRQDQLQEMVEGTIHEKLGRLYRAIVKMIMYPHETMEQLWLAFVMEEKYNKVWDSEEWVVKNNSQYVE